MIDQEKAKEPGTRELILQMAKDGPRFQDYLNLKAMKVWKGSEDCCLNWQNFEQWVKFTAKALEIEAETLKTMKQP